ncbi:hypothetical protein [Vibrio sp. 10N.261.46.A3]|uniref:hypothetical protein n=1 Tax=Vibrio sp. 10N.261.46.A3 TaxID=3229658 RepID=UPI0035503BEC
MTRNKPLKWLYLGLIVSVILFFSYYFLLNELPAINAKLYVTTLLFRTALYSLTLAYLLRKKRPTPSIWALLISAITANELTLLWRLF